MRKLRGGIKDMSRVEKIMINACCSFVAITTDAKTSNWVNCNDYFYFRLISQKAIKSIFGSECQPNYSDSSSTMTMDRNEFSGYPKMKRAENKQLVTSLTERWLSITKSYG